MDHRHRPHHPFGAAVPPPNGSPAFGPPSAHAPPPPHAPHPHHPHSHPDVDRDPRPFSAASSSSSGAPSKRIRMNSIGRSPPTDVYAHPPPHPLQFTHPRPQQPQIPQPQLHSPSHPQFPPHRQQYEDNRSPELDRRSSAGSYHRTSLPPQPSRHEAIPVNPSSTRGSPVSAFPPPGPGPAHRTSTPDVLSHHQRTHSRDAPHLFRGPPPPPSQQDQMVQQSASLPPASSQHASQQHYHRAMPPPSSPHRASLVPQPGGQPLRPPPPPTSATHHAASGSPLAAFAPGSVPPSGRDLPLPTPPRPTMSISSMLDNPAPPAPHGRSSPATSTHSLPAPNIPSSRPPEFSPVKRPFTPDFNIADRRRDVESNSASPSSGNASLPGLPGSKLSRVTPPDNVYHAHQRMQSVSAQPREREMSIGGTTPAYTLPDRLPERPMSQPARHHMPSLHGESHRRSESYSARHEKDMYDRERERFHFEREREAKAQAARERERERDWEREREREREMDRRAMEKERERQREREREREREEMREREIHLARERERDRERFGQSERARQPLQSPSASGLMFGNRGDRPGEHTPQTSSSHLSYPMTITSRFPPSTSADSNGTSAPPPTAPISTPTTMTLPQAATTLGHGPSSIPTSTSTTREGFPAFAGYTTPMPPSPFTMNASLPSLPAVGDDAPHRDGRPQGPQRYAIPYRENGGPGPRDEPARAEDALRGGLNRTLASMFGEGKGSRVDRDGIVRGPDGIMRMSRPPMGPSSPPRRYGMGLSGVGGGVDRDWAESFQKGLIDREEGNGKNLLGLGIGIGKRERDDDEMSKSERKKKHHHHHIHPNHHHHIVHHHTNDDDVSPTGLQVPALGAARSKSPHHPHHHHVHHHHPAVPPAPPKHTLVIDSQKVLASLEQKPRHYLGSVVYYPRPTPKEGYSVTQPLFPRFEGRENCIFQVRIPRRFLSEQQRKDVHRRRCVWGTEVYTDDSDVLGVLIHLGKIPGVLPEGVDPAMVSDVTRKINIIGATSATGASSSTVSSSSPTKKRANGSSTSNNKSASEKQSSSPSEPATIPPGKDLVVDLLILPTLERYKGTTRNAFKSRSWNSVHDGVSYSVWDMSWVEAGEAESRGIGSKKRRLDEREWVRRWGELPPSRGGMGGRGWEKGRWGMGVAGMGGMGQGGVGTDVGNAGKGREIGGLGSGMEVGA